MKKRYIFVDPIVNYLCIMMFIAALTLSTKKLYSYLKKGIDPQVVIYKFINSKHKLYFLIIMYNIILLEEKVYKLHMNICACVFAHVCVKDSCQTLNRGCLGAN